MPYYIYIKQCTGKFCTENRLLKNFPLHRPTFPCLSKYCSVTVSPDLSNVLYLVTVTFSNILLSCDKAEVTNTS